MCLPPVAMGLIGLAGSAVQGIGAAQAAQNEGASLDAQAQGKARDADAQKQISAYEVARTREVVQKALGGQRAGFAANGIALSGSALDVMNDTALEGELDLAAIKWNSDIKVDSLKYEKGYLEQNANVARSSAGMAFLSPVIGGVAKFGRSFG